MKEKKNEGMYWNMYINNKVQLMVKKAGETKYSLYKQF